MNLKNILQGIENIKGKGNFDIEIENIESDSRKVTKNGLFFAIKGFAVDGTDYINSAVENGAIAVVIEDEKDIKKSIGSCGICSYGDFHGRLRRENRGSCSR